MGVVVSRAWEDAGTTNLAVSGGDGKDTASGCDHFPLIRNLRKQIIMLLIRHPFVYLNSIHALVVSSSSLYLSDPLNDTFL